jgi:diguanylate cyclase (GGDEF)-like protein
MASSGQARLGRAGASLAASEPGECVRAALANRGRDGRRSASGLPRLAWALLLLGLAATADAVRRYDTRDGLQQNSVNAIAQDELGFLWFGSDTGLNRFDGRRFLAPPAAIAADIDGIAISALLAEPGVLWVGTRRDGLKRIDLRAERVAALRPGADGFPNAGITAMARDASGQLWCATDGAGVLRLRWRDGGFELRHFEPAASGLPHPRAWSITTHGDTVLVGTELGVARLRADGEGFDAVRLPAPVPAQGAVNIEEIAVAPDGAWWLGTWDHGLFRVADDAAAAIPLGTDAGGARVTSLVLVDGQPLVGFDTGVARYDPRCACLRPVPLSSNLDGLTQHAFVRALAPLADGGFFVGTWFNGVFQVPANAAAFQRLLPAHPAGSELASERVQAALEDRGGHLWVGSFGAGLQRSRAPLPQRPVVLEPVPQAGNDAVGASAIWVIREDRAGRIWVGSDGGLDRYDPHSGDWTNFPYRRDLAALPGPGVRDVLELGDGGFLVATSSGLAMIDAHDRVTPIAYARPGPNEALARTINAMRRDRDGRLWLATYDGLQVLGPDYRWLHTIDHPDLPRGLVRDLLMQPDGRLWVAAARLCRIDTRAEQLDSVRPNCLGAEAGLPEDGIQAVEAGSDGAVWASSLQGLYRLAPEQSEAQSFFVGSGLVSDEFGPGASHAGRSGRLYFGSPAGLQVFDPREVLLSAQPPRPVLTEVRVAGQPVRALPATAAGPRLDAAAAYARELVLPPGARQASFGFSLLGARRERQSIEFRIEGLHDWLPVAADTLTSHANLPAGDFRLLVRAADRASRVRSERPLLAIRVLPYWWERREVQWGGLLLLACTLFLGYRKRLRVLHQRERRLSELVTTRTREIEQQKAELALANRQLYELSIRDGLTGVFNRRHALDEARRVLLGASAQPLCLALIDLDHFKAVNDRFGHVAGDEVLRSFADWLKAQTGPGDIVGRYGGEEFLCLLHDQDIVQARHWAERLLAHVRDTDIAGPSCEIRITASIGLVAIDPRAALPLEVWIARADAALYRAKANGRDGVLVG